MTTQTLTQVWGFRLGQATQRVLRGYGSGEQQAVGWLVSTGLPAELGRVAASVIRLALISVLFYTAFWAVALAVIVVGAVWYVEKNNSSEPTGLGVHTAWDEIRNNPGYDPLPYYDIEHPNYPHELNK